CLPVLGLCHSAFEVFAGEAALRDEDRHVESPILTLVIADSAVALDGVLNPRQPLLQIRRRHDRNEFHLRIQPEKEAFGHVHYLRRLLHLYYKEAATLSLCWCGEKVSCLWLQVFGDLLHDFLQLAGANGGVAGLNGQRELNHNAHHLPPYNGSCRQRSTPRVGTDPTINLRNVLCKPTIRRRGRGGRFSSLSRTPPLPSLTRSAS